MMTADNQPTLYLISKDRRNTETIKLFADAAQARNIAVEVLDTSVVDFTNPPALRADDLLYRISTDKESSVLFKQLALMNSGIATIYDDSHKLVVAGDNVIQATLLHQAAGLPINRTVFTFTNNKDTLDKYVQYLNGYPVVVKVAEGSHGVGVMRFDSAESLYAAADFLVSTDQPMIMREYLEHDEHARLIVLNGKVIDSIAYKKTGADFRTNAGRDVEVFVKRFDKQVESAAVQAVNEMGSAFGGVDVIVDREGKIHIAEVNTPCFFPRAQLVSGIDIAGALVDYLSSKSRKAS